MLKCLTSLTLYAKRKYDIHDVTHYLHFVIRNLGIEKAPEIKGFFPK